MINLKYYLRGLGIGVIVTALIMGITAGRKKETLSNEEIRERARALGMVEESQVLADMLEEEDRVPDGEAAEPAFASSEETSDRPEDSAEPEEAPESSGSEMEEEDEPVSPDEDESPTENIETANNEDAGSSEEYVIIEVESGDGSFTVCQKLEDAGLISVASEFDRYLYENGYDKRLNVGTYEIPAGAGYEEIAKIIAKLK